MLTQGVDRCMTIITGGSMYSMEAVTNLTLARSPLQAYLPSLNHYSNQQLDDVEVKYLAHGHNETIHL